MSACSKIGKEYRRDMNRIFKTILIVWCALSTWALAQDLTVTSTINQTNVVVNQQLVFKIELSGEDAKKIDQPELPDMQDYLTFLGSGGTSQNISFVNGTMSVSKSFSYYYLATKEGSFTIPAITVEYKGKTYSSEPIQMTIQKAAAQSATPSPQTQQQAETQGDVTNPDDLYVRAIVDKKSVYQGEPILVTYRIYAAVSVTGYTITKLSDTAGFWTEDIETPQQPQVKNEVINGKNYVTADIKKVALFPTSAGNKTIGPLEMQCEVRVRNNRRRQDLFDSFFDDAFFGRTVRKAITTPAVDVEVLPLPGSGKPADFSGAVGQYKLNATVDKTDVDTDEAISLKVTLSGTGNIRMLTAPEVKIPADFEQYQPKDTENISRQNGVISGSKTFEYVLVPRFPGEQRIKPISFSYFDPKRKAYQTLTSPEIIVNVAKGSGQFVAPGGSGLSKEEVRYVGQDIRFIKLEPGSFSIIGYRVYSSAGFLTLLVLPLIGLAGAFAYKNYQDKLAGNVAYARSRKANAMAMKRLSKAKSLLNEETEKEFYAEVSNALTGFAADKLNMSKAGLISDELEKEFKIRQVDEVLTAEYFDLIKTCDFQRFAPSAVDQSAMDESYAKAKQVIIKLEKAI